MLGLIHTIINYNTWTYPWAKAERHVLCPSVAAVTREPSRVKGHRVWIVVRVFMNVLQRHKHQGAFLQHRGTSGYDVVFGAAPEQQRQRRIQSETLWIRIDKTDCLLCGNEVLYLILIDKDPINWPLWPNPLICVWYLVPAAVLE